MKKAIQFLCGELRNFDLEPSDFQLDEKENTVSFHLLSATDLFSFKRDEFLQLEDEFGALHIAEDGSFVRTRTKTFCIVHPVSTNAQVMQEGFSKLSTKVEGGICIHLRQRNFWVAVAALRREAYNEDFLPADSYRSIEVDYSEGVKKREKQEEEQLVDAYLFELAASTGLVFKKGGFIFDEPWDYEFEDDEFQPRLRPLEPFNEGMRLFTAAVKVEDAELRLLSLFKVLEFFAPIVLALDSNEALRKKLDSPAALSPDANYLQSVFDLVRSLEKRRNDNEMIRLVFETCLDFVELSKMLPSSRFKKVNYGDKRADIDAQCRSAAEVLVATRNEVAHAKSDYRPIGNELKANELPDFNVFLEAAAVQTVRWYNRLPAHLKLKF